jgi:hypothetical protein
VPPEAGAPSVAAVAAPVTAAGAAVTWAPSSTAESVVYMEAPAGAAAGSGRGRCNSSSGDESLVGTISSDDEEITVQVGRCGCSVLTETHARSGFLWPRDRERAAPSRGFRWKAWSWHLRRRPQRASPTGRCSAGATAAAKVQAPAMLQPLDMSPMAAAAAQPVAPVAGTQGGSDSGARTPERPRCRRTCPRM